MSIASCRSILSRYRYYHLYNSWSLKISRVKRHVSKSPRLTHHRQDGASPPSTMDTPILVVARVINVDADKQTQQRHELLVRITRQHTVEHLKLALWQHIPTGDCWIEYKQKAVPDDRELGDILPKDEKYTRDFTFWYFDDGSNYRPDAPIAAVRVSEDDKRSTIREYRLDTTVGEILADCGISEAAGISSGEWRFCISPEDITNGDWRKTSCSLQDDSTTLSDLLGLDVAPLDLIVLSTWRQYADIDYTFELRLDESNDPITFTLKGEKSIADLIKTIGRVTGHRKLTVPDLTNNQRIHISEVYLPCDSPIKLSAYSEKFVPIEPLKVVVDNNPMELTGKTFEQVRSGDGTVQLLPQHEISSTLYRISLDYGGEVKEVELNESQAIIVDNEVDPPYLLLSPSGALKVHATFRGSDGETLLQHVKVILHTTDDPPVAHDNRRGDEVNHEFGLRNTLQAGFEFARRFSEVVAPLFERIFMYGLGILIFANMFGISMFLPFWYYAAAIAGFVGALFAVFVAGERVAEFLESLVPERQPERRSPFERTVLVTAQAFRQTLRTTRQTCTLIRTEIVRMVVRRPYDFELIIDRDRNMWYRFATWLLIVSKDFFIFVITLFPQSATIVAEEQGQWAADEFDTLKRRTKHFASTVNLLIEAYNEKFTPDYQLIEGCDYDQVELVVNNEDSGEGVRERKYCLLIDCYRAYSHAYNSLNKALSTKTPLDGGRLREDNQ